MSRSGRRGKYLSKMYERAGIRNRASGDAKLLRMGFNAGWNARGEADGKQIEAALEVASRWSQIDCDHHKAWAIDQMVRALTGDQYEDWIRKYKTEGDDPDAFDWHEGIAP